MLKSMGRRGSARAVMLYLAKGKGGGTRVRAFRSNLCSEDEDWAALMDARLRNARTRSRRGERTYWHFVVSPDPHDGLAPEDVADLAAAWAEERHPGARWVVEVHDDNGIPHAHIVMSAVLDDGSRLHVSKAESKADADALQAMCAERGLGHFANGVPAEKGASPQRRAARVEALRASQERVREERRRAGEPAGGAWRGTGPGNWSWVEDVRQEVDRCLVSCPTFAEFERRMREDGYGVELTRRRGSGVSVTYTHPTRGEAGQERKVKGRRLDPSGGAYDHAGIVARLQPGLADGRTYTAFVRPVRERRSFEERLRDAAQGRRKVGIQQVVDACAWVAAEGIVSAADALEAQEAAKTRSARAGSDLAEARHVLERAQEAMLLAAAAEQGDVGAAHRLADGGYGVSEIHAARAARASATVAVRRAEQEDVAAEEAWQAARGAVRVIRACGLLDALEGTAYDRAAREATAAVARRPGTFRVTVALALDPEELGRQWEEHARQRAALLRAAARMRGASRDGADRALAGVARRHTERGGGAFVTAVRVSVTRDGRQGKRQHQPHPKVDGGRA